MLSSMLCTSKSDAYIRSYKTRLNQIQVPLENCGITDPYIRVRFTVQVRFSSSPYRESEDIALVYYSSDQELNRNGRWSVDTVLGLTICEHCHCFKIQYFACSAILTRT